MTEKILGRSPGVPSGPWGFKGEHLAVFQACCLAPRIFALPAVTERRLLSRKRSCSRLERSPRQRAVPEGLVAPKEGCPTARIVLHLQVRAVHRIWQNKRPFQQAGLATPHRWGKTIGADGHPSDRATKPSCTVRAHRRGRWRYPVAAAARTRRLAWASTQNSTTRRRTELVVDRAPLPVIRPS